MDLYFNPRSAILLAVFIQAVVTAFLVLQRGIKHNRQSDNFLSALLFFLGLSLTDFIIGFLGFYDKFPWLTFFPFENLYAITVFLYLFCVALLQNDEPNTRTVQKHLAIPVIYFVSCLIVFLLPTATKQQVLSRFYFPFFIYIESLLYYIISAYYFVHIVRVVQKHSQIANEHDAQISTSVLNWFRYFIVGFMVYITIDFVLSASSVLFDFNFEQQYWKYIVRAMLTSFLSIAGYNFDEKVSLPNMEFDKLELVFEKKETLLSEKELQNLKQKIILFFETEKPFLEPELDLNQLSKQLELTNNVVSYAINKGFEKNFNDFVNSHRVNAVIEKLKNPANAHFTLIAIAFDCGFNSKTTFNRVFKRLVQKSPKEFLKEVKKIS